MVSGVTSPSGDLNQLRQQYDRLCDLMTRAAESDPAAAERVLDELETLSERILALEAAEDAAPEPSAEAPAPEDAAGRQTRDPAPEATSPPGRAEPANGPRIVSFRVTPVTAEAGHSAPAKPSWRIDARPRAPDDEAQPSAPAKPGPAAEPEPAPALPTAPQEQRAAPPDRPAGRGNATVFSAAIRQWLERHRQADAPGPSMQASPPAGDADSPAAPESDHGRRQASAKSVRTAAAIEQQAAQIDRIMRLCEEHQAALEALRSRIEEQLQAQPHTPPEPRDGPSLDQLSLAVEEQRSRITALAKTIHNLAQWLAAQHAAPDR